MPKILISEQKPQPAEDSFAVKLKFDDADEFEGLMIQNPFAPQDEKRLEWHFEKYVSSPFLKDVEPREAQEIIRKAGEILFSQLFSQPQIYSRYQQIKSDLRNLVIEISGSPEFHSLHWEALKDPKLSKAFALDAAVTRKYFRPQNLQADVRETTTINLLIVTARPEGRRDVGYRTISRPLVELIRNSQLAVKIDILRPATYKSLERHLDNVDFGYYQVIHFDVHGALLSFEQFEKIEREKPIGNLTYQPTRYGRDRIDRYEGKDAFLFFDDYREPQTKNDDGFRADPVRADELANLLLKHGIPIVILNACQSAKELGEQERESSLPVAEETSLASGLMEAGAQMVVGMSYSITVTAAEILMKSFYQEIFRGKSPNRALQIGRKELFNQKERRAAWNFKIEMEDWLLPVVYQKQNVELKTARLTPQEEEQLNLAQQEISQMPEVEYGFYGRDIDILNMERRVLLENNILLIRGMGGAGKTTLLRHLAWWWRATNFVQKVFYFGYDDKAYTRQEIMFAIAEKLYDRFEFSAFQAMDERAQQQKLAQKLRTERHLLILDNLESIQGRYFAVKNTLSAEEQAKLIAFLAELRGAVDPFQEQTIVLLGSRSPEEWLADATFKKNVYDLGGLDPESTTQFAEEILRQNEVSHYRNEEDFKKLLKLLAGFPLPMKVVLENLKRQTPSEILAALQAGDVNFRTGTIDDKTKDILKCIEYSFRSITPEKQELLLCLAPFTSVISLSYFEKYIEELKNQKALAHLKHELWNEVFNESIQRGLMSQQEGLPFVQLQPTLPYFLKIEWQKPERGDFQKAISNAFFEYYTSLGITIRYFLNSANINERNYGRFLANMEFENIDSCLEDALKTETSVLALYTALSCYYDAIQDQEAGLELGLKVYERLENYPPETLEERENDVRFILYDIGLRFYSLRVFEEAETFLLLALELANNAKNLEDFRKKEIIAPIYKDLGNVATELHEWEKSEMYYQKAFQIYTELNRPDLQASIFYNLAIIAYEQNQFEKAEHFYLDALQIYANFQDHYKQALIFLSLGTLYSKKPDWAKASNYYEMALKVFNNFNDYQQQARTLTNLGSVATELNEWEKADYYFQQALQISIGNKDQYSQAQTYAQLGGLKLNQERFHEARSYLLQAFKTLIAFNDSDSLGIVLHNLRYLYRKSGDQSLLKEIATLLGTTSQKVSEMFDQKDQDIKSED